jgi:hypothetical protein
MIATTKSDSQIKTDVNNELKWDPRIDEAEVGVQVKNGIVTLTGNISAYPKRLAAIEAAHRVYGVLDVVDEMKVRIPSFWERTGQDIASAALRARRTGLGCGEGGVRDGAGWAWPSRMIAVEYLR